MKKIVLRGSLLVLLGLSACKGDSRKHTDAHPENNQQDTTVVEKLEQQVSEEAVNPIVMSKDEAEKLAKLPLDCVHNQFPNKLGQTLASKADLKLPKELHPSFYGCFDWHSAVHGHWSLVSLLKQFPNLEQTDKIKSVLTESLSTENIQQELAYFKKEHNQSYERTYGWAWLLKLAEELKTWEDPLGKELYANLKPLSDLIADKYMNFLPKLRYPIRVGEHENTAFGMAFAYDYAQATENQAFLDLLSKRAKDFYLNDDNCPISWEPGGFDFLSPCLEEVDLMQRVLSKAAFEMWLEDFMPQLMNKDFSLEVAEVSDRTDGKLVHLDGLNFSRAWVFYHLADKYEAEFGHLRTLADKHVDYSYPNLMGDSYEGGHWLGTFAIYSIQQRK